MKNMISMEKIVYKEAVMLLKGFAPYRKEDSKK